MNKKFQPCFRWTRSANRQYRGLRLLELCFGATLFANIMSSTALAETIDHISLNINTSCTLSTTGSGNYGATFNPGGSAEIIGSPISVLCNDIGGYSLYAVGFSGNNIVSNNTKMLASNDNNNNISTGTSGSNSYWAMKATGSGASIPTIANSYDTYQVIPANYTLISHYDSFTTGASVTTATYKISMSRAQAADTYTGKVKYLLVNPHLDNAETLGLTMQESSDATLAALMPNNGDVAYLSDERDSQIYSVAKINGKYWMTRNLAIGCAGTGNTYSATINSKSLTSNDSNISAAWSTPTNLLSTTANSSATSGYTVSAMQCDANYGAYYNFIAATADTISGSDNSTESTYDICPKGWRLPTGSEVSGIISYVQDFSPTFGGYYSGGVANVVSTRGVWWSSTSPSNNSAYRIRLVYNGNTMYTGGYYRYNGNSIRCVKK